MIARRVAILPSALAVLASPPAAVAQVGTDAAAQPYLGVWESEDETVVLRFTPDKAAILYRDALMGHDFVNVYRVRYDGNGAQLVRVGETLSATAGSGETLALRTREAPLTLRRSPDLPEALVLQAYAIAVAAHVSSERIDAIRRELAERARRDQEVRASGVPGDSAELAELLDTDADNTSYLRRLMQEVGWITMDRYGREAAANAFLLVQHSRDLRLMLTVLPQIERELPTGAGSGQDFALLYDRVMANLAEPQRYGTQASQGADGGWTVYCLESPVMVDDYRARLGLPPLADYLAMLAEAYGVDEVAVESACPW